MTVALIAVLFSCSNASKTSSQEKRAWGTADSTRKLIVAPTFKNADYKITDYGAALDSNVKSTEA